MQHEPALTSNESNGRRDALTFLALFAGAFLLRLLYLFEISSFPLFDFLISDGRRYDEWAQEIAGGDWLGSGVYYQAPLYPYFLGAVQGLIGRDLWWIRIVQIALGAFSCSLLYLAGRWFFSRKVGITAGLILAMYAPGIFSDGIFQKTVLDQFLICLLLALIGYRCARSVHVPASGTGWLWIGFVLGLLGLTRENSLVWLGALPLWMVFAQKTLGTARRARNIAWYLGGLGLVLLPVGFRNLHAGGEFTLTTSQFGPNFYIGNNPAADGTYNPLRPGFGDARFERRDATELAERDLGRALSPREVSHYWLGQSLDYMRSQPLDWLRLLWRKWLLLWNVAEIEDADDYYLYRAHSRLLATLGLFAHFGTLAPLAAVGLLVTFRDRRRLAVLYVLLATLAVSVAAFYVFGRYRYSIVPLLVPFAAAALVHGYELVRERRFKALTAPFALWIVTSTLVFWPVIEKGRPGGAGYTNLGNALSALERDTEALAAYTQALQQNANNISAHYNLGNLHLRLGQLAEARAQFETVLRLNSEHAQAHNNLGTVRGRGGDAAGALAAFQRAVEIDPHLAHAQLNLALSLLRNGRAIEAEAPIRKVLADDPESAAGWSSLGQWALALGDLDAAAEHFRHALLKDPAFENAKRGLARIQRQRE